MVKELNNDAKKYFDALGVKYFRKEQLTAIQESSRHLQKLEILFCKKQMNSVILSYQRVRKIWGTDYDLSDSSSANDRVISGIEFDLRITDHCDYPPHVIKQSIALLEQIVSAYFSYTSQYIRYRLEELGSNTVEVENSHIEVMASTFLHEYVFEFLLSPDSQELGDAGTLLHKFIREKTRRMLSRKLKVYTKQIAHQNEKRTEKPHKQKLESWQNVLSEISLPQFFHIISILTRRQQLCVLMHFGYLYDIRPSDFYADYDLSENAYNHSLSSSLEIFSQHITQNSPENIPAVHDSAAKDIVLNAFFMEPADLGRFTSNLLLNENKTTEKLYLLISKHGERLLNKPLTHRQKELLKIILTHLSTNQNAFISIQEMIAITELNPGTIYDELDRLYTSLTRPDDLFVYNAKHGMRKLRPDNDTHMFRIARAHKDNTLDWKKLDDHPREKFVVQTFLNPVNSVYPNLSQIAEMTGYTFASVRYCIMSAHRVLFDREKN